MQPTSHLRSEPESAPIILGGNHVNGVLNIINPPLEEVDRLLAKAATGALYNTAAIKEPARCHPGTREAIRRRLRASLDVRSAEKSFTWLHGAAGVGKSAIARTLCEELHADDQLLVSFFFFRNSHKRNNASRFIATLALQFQAIIPELQSHIKRYIHQHPHIFTQSVDTQAEQLIIEPIQQLHDQGVLSSTRPIAVVIDGLDECEIPEDRQNVLDVLYKLKSQLPFPVTTLVASRPARDIVKAFKLPPFEGDTVEECLNLEADVDADILKFYLESFAKIEKFHILSPHFTRVNSVWPAPDIIEVLVKKTSGQFVFAKTVIRFVEPDTSNPDEYLQIILGILPPLHYRPFQQLDAIYMLVLSRIEPERIEGTLMVLGAFLCNYQQSWINVYVLPPNRTPFHETPPRDVALVEWMLELRPGQCRQLLVGLEALLTVSPNGEMQVFRKSFTDFLFDPSRSEQFYIKSDLVYERVLRSIINHRFYNPIRDLYSNMGFLFSNARITPELRSAITSIDFVQSDAIYRLSEPPLEWSEDTHFGICDLFTRSLLDSNIPDKHDLAEPFLESLRTVATNRLSPYLDNPALWPLLYVATRSDPPEEACADLVDLVHTAPLGLLHQEQTNGYHLSFTDRNRRKPMVHVLFKTGGVPLEVARAANPQLQSTDGYIVTLLLEMVHRCIEGAIEPSFLVSSRFLGRALRFRSTEPHEVLEKKLCVFASMFKEQVDEVTIASIKGYQKRVRRKADRERHSQRDLWDSNDPYPISHHLTDDWNILEDIIAAERVKLEARSKRSLRHFARFLPSYLFCIPIVLAAGMCCTEGIFSFISRSSTPLVWMFLSFPVASSLFSRVFRLLFCVLAFALFSSLSHALGPVDFVIGVHAVNT